MCTSNDYIRAKLYNLLFKLTKNWRNVCMCHLLGDFKVYLSTSFQQRSLIAQNNII